MTYFARLLLTAQHPSDQRLSRAYVPIRPRLALAIRSAPTPSPRVSTPSPYDLHAVYTVPMRPPYDLHTVSTPSGFGRLLGHIGWPIYDVLIKQLGSDKRYRGHAAGEGGIAVALAGPRLEVS